MNIYSLMKNPIIPIEQQFINKPGEKQWDYKAICCFAATGFFLDNDTYYTNQKVLRPATEYVDGQEKPYFKWHYAPRDITFSQAVDEFADLFEYISREQLGGAKIILPLSGGLDSRSLAAALKGKTYVHTYSYKFEHSFDETKYGKEIAKRMGWKFDEFVIPHGYLWEKIDDLSKINQCYADFVSPRQMAVVDSYPTMGDVFYLGHGGDLFFDSMGVKDTLSLDDQLETLYKIIVRKGGLELAESLWRYWGIEGSFEEYFRERMRNYLSSIDIDNANARLRAFKSYYYVPRWTCVNLAIFAKYHPLSIPYFDNRMCEWLCTIPEKYLAGRQIQIEFIKRKAPELASIPWETYSPCNLYNYAVYNSFSKQIVVVYHKIIRRLNEIVSGRVCTARNWEIQYLGKENDNQLRGALLSDSGIAPKEVCQIFYNKFIEGNQEQKVWYSHPISTLLVLTKKCE